MDCALDHVEELRFSHRSYHFGQTSMQLLLGKLIEVRVLELESCNIDEVGIAQHLHIVFCWKSNMSRSNLTHFTHVKGLVRRALLSVVVLVNVSCITGLPGRLIAENVSLEVIVLLRLCRAGLRMFWSLLTFSKSSAAFLLAKISRSLTLGYQGTPFEVFSNSGSVWFNSWPCRSWGRSWLQSYNGITIIVNAMDTFTEAVEHRQYLLHCWSVVGIVFFTWHLSMR